MAIAIKSIPVLEGDAAKRFNAMADVNHHRTKTNIPENVRKSIVDMIERSRNFKLKKKN